MSIGCVAVAGQALELGAQMTGEHRHGGTAGTGFGIAVVVRIGVDVVGVDDACAVGDAACPATDGPRAKFTIVDNIDAGLKHRYEAFLSTNGIDVAGIEFVTDSVGAVYTYDVNTNTNYNPDAEARAGRSGMEALASYLGAELERVSRRRDAAD